MKYYLIRLYRHLNKLYKKYFIYLIILLRLHKKYDLVFIHIPKNAGTSMSVNLYGFDIGHSKVSDYKKILSQKNFNKLKFFSIYRDPVERVISIYNYLSKRPGIKDVEHQFHCIYKSKDINEFVNKYLTTEYITNYFFQSQYKYIEGAENLIMLDINKLPDSFKEISKKYNLPNNLNHLNKGGDKKCKLTLDNIKKIQTVYKSDYEIKC